MSESLVIIKGILPTSILAVGSHKLMINSGYTILLFPRIKPALIKTSTRM